MSLVWEQSTRVAHSGSQQLTLNPSSMSNHDQRPHVCHNPALDPNTLAVAR
jgi:hypothetical protein